MKKISRLLPFCFTFLTVSLLITSANALTASSHPYDRGYDHGYDDGYDDAMDDCPCPPWYYLLSGFYAGIGEGYEGYQISNKPWIYDDYIGTFNTHANGWNTHAFGGYGHYFNNHYYLAGEAFIGNSTAEGTDTVHTYGTNYYGKFTAGTSIGASLLPGFKLGKDEPLIYGRIGIVDTQLMKNDVTGTWGNNITNWTTGLNLGLGVEVPLYKQLSGRLEYDYINYNSFNNKGSLGSSSAPADNRGSLDLIYHFK